MFFAILFVLVFAVSVNAQKDTAFAVVHYTLTHICDTTKPDDPNKENMILYLGKNSSIYGSYDKIVRVKNASTRPITFTGPNGIAMSAPAPTAELTVKVLAAENYYKDFVQSKLSFVLPANGWSLFAIEEEMPVIEWTITQETKQIIGLPCQKATGDFKGRTYEAWFTSQLPYSNGPWKLGGLPGLIIEAADTKKEVIFKMISFENAIGEQVSTAVPESASRTTRKEFNEYKAALEKDRQALVGSSGARSATTNGTISAGSVSIDGKPVIIRRMNNPIEKEAVK
jgi:GLPGLI family protein